MHCILDNLFQNYFRFDVKSKIGLLCSFLILYKVVTVKLLYYLNHFVVS